VTYASSKASSDGAQAAVKLRSVNLLVLMLAVSAHAEEPRLQCDIGPASRIFGSVRWFVYGCSDGASLVILSPPDSPASPFYFVLSPDGKGYKLKGDGAEPNATTEAARKELEALSPSDIRGLLREARLASKH
jgi:hypothetical protein